MQEFRVFRKKVLKMTGRQIALLMAACHTDILRSEKKESHHKVTYAFYECFMEEHQIMIRSLLCRFVMLTRPRPLTPSEVVEVETIAKRFLSEEQIEGWLTEFHERLKIHLKERENFVANPKKIRPPNRFAKVA